MSTNAVTRVQPAHHPPARTVPSTHRDARLAEATRLARRGLNVGRLEAGEAEVRRPRGVLPLLRVLAGEANPDATLCNGEATV